MRGAPIPQPMSPRQVPEAMLQEVLPKVLKPDLNSVLGSPEHLELFLLAQQKVPKKLEKLMGPVNLFSDESIPRCEGGGEMGSLGLGAASPSTGLRHGLGSGVHVAPGPWPCLFRECPLSPLRLPLQAGDCAEDGGHLREEGTQAACRGFGPAPPGAPGRQLPTVLEGSCGTRAPEEAVLAGQVRECLTSLHPFSQVC